ncbi:MAG: hypothetical protein P8N43_05590 [Alphaproteobacteria bacterium]|nr:hypothetical protein [Alphaproteobacteria bacterium]
MTPEKFDAQTILTATQTVADGLRNQHDKVWILISDKSDVFDNQRSVHRDWQNNMIDAAAGLQHMRDVLKGRVSATRLKLAFDLDVLSKMSKSMKQFASLPSVDGFGALSDSLIDLESECYALEAYVGSLNKSAATDSNAVQPVIAAQETAPPPAWDCETKDWKRLRKECGQTLNEQLSALYFNDERTRGFNAVKLA